MQLVKYYENKLKGKGEFMMGSKQLDQKNWHDRGDKKRFYILSLFLLSGNLKYHKLKLLSSCWEKPIILTNNNIHALSHTHTHRSSQELTQL